MCNAINLYVHKNREYSFAFFIKQMLKKLHLHNNVDKTWSANFQVTRALADSLVKVGHKL